MQNKGVIIFATGRKVRADLRNGSFCGPTQVSYRVPRLIVTVAILSITVPSYKLAFLTPSLRAMFKWTPVLAQISESPYICDLQKLSIGSLRHQNNHSLLLDRDSR